MKRFVMFIDDRVGRLARVTDLNASMIYAWMDDLAATGAGCAACR